MRGQSLANIGIVKGTSFEPRQPALMNDANLNLF
jgi:hypothetical protein